MTNKGSFFDRVEMRELSNGSKLAVLANPHAPTATIAGTLHAGPAYAADGRFAVPGITAAMLDRGTGDYDRLTLARELEDHGLQLLVRASSGTPTIVSFSAQGLEEELPRMVKLLFEVLRRPTFPQQELDKFREQVLGSLVRERQETNARAFAALSRRVYPDGHPLLRRPIEVREQEVSAITREDLTSFHESTYGPRSLTIAVVGQVDGSEVASIIDTHMSGWDGDPAEMITLPAGDPPPPSEERIQIADRPNLDVYLGHRGNLLRGADDYAAAILANSCLGQSTLTSRLGVEVRDHQGLTYGIYSRFFGTLHVPGLWAVALGVSADNLDRAVAASRDVITQYVGEGPTEAELDDERMALSGAYRVGLATNSGVARELVTALTAGEGVERLDRFPEELLEVSRDQVMAAISQHFHPEQLVLTAAGDFGDRG